MKLKARIVRPQRSRLPQVAALPVAPPPSASRSMPYWAKWLIGYGLWCVLVAVLQVYVSPLSIYFAAIALVVRIWWWLTCRFPVAMSFVNIFLAVFISPARSRRW